jgi:hypothetical protein
MKKLVIAAIWITAAPLVPGHAARAQPTATGGPTPTERGTAVLHRGPVGADTLPILCRDAERPEAGFVTETGDPEWTPRVALSLSPTVGAERQITVLLSQDGRDYEASFPYAESREGYYTVGIWVDPTDGSAGKDIYFTATCRERLARR